MTHFIKTILFVFSVCYTFGLAQAASAAGFAVDDAFVRATPQKISAGYLELTNNTGTDDALLRVTADWAGRIELHNTVMSKDGVMSMIPVAAITLPAGQTVKLSPGGMHIMLFDLKTPLTVGETRTAVLHFQHALEQSVTFTVQLITYKGAEYSH